MQNLGSSQLMGSTTLWGSSGVYITYTWKRASGMINQTAEANVSSITSNTITLSLPLSIPYAVAELLSYIVKIHPIIVLHNFSGFATNQFIEVLLYHSLKWCYHNYFLKFYIFISNFMLQLMYEWDVLSSFFVR